MKGPIRFFGKSLSAFQEIGLLGYFAGFILSLIVAFWKLPEIVFSLILLLPVSFVGMYLLAWIEKIIKGKDDLVFLHHLLFYLIEAALILKFSYKSDLRGFDIMVFGFSVFAGFGRLACFKNGCCHGIPHPLGVIYSDKYLRSSFPKSLINIPILAVQLIESIGIFTLALFELVFISFDIKSGWSFLLFLSGYSILRFFLEFFRADTGRPFLYGFSEAQWTSLGLTFALSISFFIAKLPFLLPLIAFFTILIGMIAAFMIHSKYSAPVRLLRKPENQIEFYEAIRKAFNSASNENGVFFQKLKGAEDLEIGISTITKGQNRKAIYSFSFRNGLMSNLDAQYLQQLILAYRQNSILEKLSERNKGIWILEVTETTNE